MPVNAVRLAPISGATAGRRETLRRTCAASRYSTSLIVVSHTVGDDWQLAGKERFRAVHSASDASLWAARSAGRAALAALRNPGAKVVNS